MRSVKDYVGNSAAQAMSAHLRQSLRSSKFLKVTSKPVGQRSFRWITTDLGL
jgi:photosystem II stability/assembly factor-like uncharacterized protein